MNAKQRAESLNEEGKCIICEDVHARRTRGLCMRHYEQYRRKRDSLKSELVSAWEDALVKAGKLMPNRQGKQLDSDQDAFAGEFEAFLAENPDAIAKKPNTITNKDIDATLAEEKKVRMDKRASKKKT